MTAELQAIRDRHKYRKQFDISGVQDITALLAEIDRLAVENQGLKCCGNCKHFGKFHDNCDDCFGFNQWEGMK